MNSQGVALRRLEGQLGGIRIEITEDVNRQSVAAFCQLRASKAPRVLLQSIEIGLQEPADVAAQVDTLELDMIRIEPGHEVAKGHVASGLGPERTRFTAEQLAHAQGERRRYIFRQLGLLAVAVLAVVVPWRAAMIKRGAV